MKFILFCTHSLEVSHTCILISFGRALAPKSLNRWTRANVSIQAIEHKFKIKEEKNRLGQIAQNHSGSGHLKCSSNVVYELKKKWNWFFFCVNFLIDVCHQLAWSMAFSQYQIIRISSNFTCHAHVILPSNAWSMILCNRGGLSDRKWPYP